MTREKALDMSGYSAATALEFGRVERIIKARQPVLGKPRIRLLVDRYAVLNCEHWVCSYCGVCARGATPSSAYLALIQHFAAMRSMYGGIRLRQPEGFA